MSRQLMVTKMVFHIVTKILFVFSISSVAMAQFIPFANWTGVAAPTCDMAATSYTTCKLTTATYSYATVTGWTKTDGDGVCAAALGAGYCWAKDGNLSTVSMRQAQWNFANSLGASAQVCAFYGTGNHYTGWAMNSTRTAANIINIGPIGAFDDGYYAGTTAQTNSCMDPGATYNRFSAANIICCK